MAATDTKKRDIIKNYMGGHNMRKDNIDGGNTFDWGKTSKNYAKYRDIYPNEFYKRIVDLGLCVKGQNVLDLGTGTGVLPRNLYRFGAKFIGADISENQINEARKLSQNNGMDINYIVASAEDVNFPERSFDVITACQCFQYFNTKITLPKIHDMLKDDGRFCILWMAWLPDEDKIAGMSENLVLKYNPSWTGAGEKRSGQSIPGWAKSLFEVKNSIVYDINVPFTRESWHGRMKACRGIGASSLSDEAIAGFDKEHIKILSEVPETFDILHYVAILDLQKKVS